MNAGDIQQCDLVKLMEHVIAGEVGLVRLFDGAGAVKEPVPNLITIIVFDGVTYAVTKPKGRK